MDGFNIQEETYNDQILGLESQIKNLQLLKEKNEERKIEALKICTAKRLEKDDEIERIRSIKLDISMKVGQIEEIVKGFS